MGRSDRRAITHQLERLLLHLLKWVYQPDQRARQGRGWRGSVRQARTAIADLLEESPSLRDYPAQRVALAYRRARQQSAIQTGFPLRDVSRDLPLELGATPGRGLLARGWREMTMQDIYSWVQIRSSQVMIGGGVVVGIYQYFGVLKRLIAGQ